MPKKRESGEGGPVFLTKWSKLASAQIKKRRKVRKKGITERKRMIRHINNKIKGDKNIALLNQ